MHSSQPPSRGLGSVPASPTVTLLDVSRSQYRLLAHVPEAISATVKSIGHCALGCLHTASPHLFSSVATMRSMLASVNFRGRPDLRGAFFCARRRLMDDNERSSRREMSLRVLPCSKWRRRTRACSLAVMRGVLEASMSTRSATMWAKLQAVGIKRLWTQLMDVENLTCMSPSDR